MLSERILFWLVVILVSLWLLCSIMAPVLMETGQVLPAIVLYRAYAVICHQDISRSLLVKGFPMAVCVRCTGLSFGFLLGWCTAARGVILSRRWLLFAIVPMLVDWSLGVSNLWQNTTGSRLLTGCLAGSAFAWWLRQRMRTEFRRLYSGEELLHG